MSRGKKKTCSRVKETEKQSMNFNYTHLLGGKPIKDIVGDKQANV